MRVFISWSGETSRQLGEVIRKWLPGALQYVRPYFTPDDIEKGTRWNTEIAKHLEDSAVGLFCLTRENLVSPWMTFEAGALSKHVDKSRVCSILFGLDNADLKGPLVQFQTTLFSREDIKKLLKTINGAAGDQKLEDTVLDSVFDMWWPRLEEGINAVLHNGKQHRPAAVRTERELIEEILELTRLSAVNNRATPLDRDAIRILAKRAADLWIVSASSPVEKHLVSPIQHLMMAVRALVSESEDEAAVKMLYSAMQRKIVAVSDLPPDDIPF